MPAFAVMVRCKSGTRYLYGDSWLDVMTTMTHTGHDTVEDAVAEAARIQPVGFDRDGVQVWIAPWSIRFNTLPP